MRINRTDNDVFFEAGPAHFDHGRIAHYHLRQSKAAAKG
jgi:hypothetical protein